MFPVVAQWQGGNGTCISPASVQYVTFFSLCIINILYLSLGLMYEEHIFKREFFLEALAEGQDICVLFSSLLPRLSGVWCHTGSAALLPALSLPNKLAFHNTGYIFIDRTVQVTSLSQHCPANILTKVLC